MKLQVERKVQETLGELYGKYYQLSKLDGKVKEYLNNIGVNIDRSASHDAAGINDDWPVGRGVFIDDNYNFALLVNFEDHIQVISSTDKADISKPLQNVTRVLTKFSKMVFSQDSALGYLTASPQNIGTALDLYARVVTHTNLSKKTSELVMKNYKCELAKMSKRNYQIKMA